ncbi:MAG: PQQ-binding-like beta-propeller repeat protein [Bacillota bacterium]
MLIKWKFRVKGQIESGVAIDREGTIYCTDNKGIIYAIDAQGNKNWEFDTGGTIKSEPTVGIDGNLYVKVHKINDYELQSITPLGNQRWSLSIGSNGNDSPTIGKDGTIYLSGMKLYAISPAGYRQWGVRSSSGNSITTSPVIGNNEMIYFKSDNDSKLYAVTEEGTIKWEYQLSSGSFWSGAAIGQEGIIYIGSAQLHAINSNGTKKWDFSPEDWVTSNIVVGEDETIYFGSGEELYAVDRNGQLEWTFATAGDILTSPVLAEDGLIYIASDKLYVINKQGEEVKNLDTGGFLSDPVIDLDGTIYVGSGQELYAISDQNGGLATTSWPVLNNNLQHTSRRSDIFLAKQCQKRQI